MQIFSFLIDTVNKIRGKVVLSLSQIAISMLSIAFFRSLPKLKTHSSDAILTQNLILRNSNHVFISLYEDWHRSFDLHNDGFYYDAVDLRKHVLSTIYRLADCDEASYYPSILTHGFATGIGHQANLLLHTAARDLNLVPPGPRYLITNSKAERTPLLQVALAKYLELPSLEPSWSNNPLIWNLLEQNELLRGNGEFIDQYDFYQRVFQGWRVKGQHLPLIQLPESYLSETREFLKKFGVDSSQGYVALHVRENNNPDDPRNVSVKNYIGFAQNLLSRGYTVIRFGVGKMSPFPASERLIDLSILDEDMHSQFHPGIIACSDALVATLSGPLALGYLFNVPTLATNVVATSLNAISTIDRSLYLPKKIISVANNRVLALHEVLSSRLGYGLIRNKAMNALGFKYVENTIQELINSFDELLKFDAHDTFENRNIQQDCGTVGRGLISQLVNTST